MAIRCPGRNNHNHLHICIRTKHLIGKFPNIKPWDGTCRKVGRVAFLQDTDHSKVKRLPASDWHKAHDRAYYERHKAKERMSRNAFRQRRRDVLQHSDTKVGRATSRGVGRETTPAGLDRPSVHSTFVSPLSGNTVAQRFTWVQLGGDRAARSAVETRLWPVGPRREYRATLDMLPSPARCANPTMTVTPPPRTLILLC